MKKNYLKPNAEHIAFYSEEDIAVVLPLEDNIEGRPELGESVVDPGVNDWT